MARPRKDSNVVATEKIEKALWELLREEKYSNITVQKFADKAGVNRNAIYYHYENIDDVAKMLFYIICSQVLSSNLCIWSCMIW